MTKAALYARVSTDAQQKEGTIESQLVELKRQMSLPTLCCKFCERARARFERCADFDGRRQFLKVQNPNFANSKNTKRKTRTNGNCRDAATRTKYCKTKTRGSFSNLSDRRRALIALISSRGGVLGTFRPSNKTSGLGVLLYMKRLSPSLPDGHQKGVSVVGSIFE